MNKADEIKLIEQLGHGDTYFADTFTEEDIQIMTKNIRNDYPLLSNTFIDKEIKKKEAAEGKVREQEAQLGTREFTIKDMELELGELRAWKRLMLASLLKKGEGDLAAEFFTSQEIIKSKLQNGIALDSTESKNVLNQLQY